MDNTIYIKYFMKRNGVLSCHCGDVIFTVGSKITSKKVCQYSVCAEKKRGFVINRQETPNYYFYSEYQVIYNVSIPKTATVNSDVDNNGLVNKDTMLTSELILVREFTRKEYRYHYLKMVAIDGLIIRSVADQTPEICWAAVSRTAHALSYVTEKTPELCMEAVKQNGLALYYVTDKTLEICMEAVKQNGLAIIDVPISMQTPDICSEAIKNYGYATVYMTRT